MTAAATSVESQATLPGSVVVEEEEEEVVAEGDLEEEDAVEEGEEVVSSGVTKCKSAFAFQLE